MGNFKIILEIKEKSDRSLVYLGEALGNAKNRKKETLKKENISLELLPAIDRLLKKNSLSLDPTPIPGKRTKKNRAVVHKNWCGVDKISEYKIISDVPKNWTSVRIAKITFEVLGLAR